MTHKQMEKSIRKEIQKIDGDYVYENRVFFNDGTGSIFERGEKENVFYCNRNGRSSKQAIVENIMQELYS